MGLRYAIIIFMLIVYTITWLLHPRSDEFAVVSGILAVDAVLGAVLHFLLNRKYKALLMFSNKAMK